MRINEIIVESPNIATKTFKKLYHVGSMDAAQKRSGSYEGAGLSVSTHPDAWRRIARGFVTGDTFELTKQNNTFINANRLTGVQKNLILSWAEKNQLVEKSDIYRVSYYDDELEDTVYSDYPDIESARHEADSPEDIEKISGGVKPTDKLKQATNNPHLSSTGILDYILPLYADTIGLDGVWWQDVLDVTRLSAPRGVIVPSKINTWNIIKI